MSNVHVSMRGFECVLASKAVFRAHNSQADKSFRGSPDSKGITMGSEQQERNATPLHSKGTTNLQRNQVSLSDVTNVIGEVAQTYDKEYTDLCHVLQDVADDVEEIKRHRLTNISSLRDDIEKLLSTVSESRKSATDTTRLERHRQQVQHLQRQKQKLIKDIMAGKSEEKELRNKLHRVEQQMELVRQERATVNDQTISDLPSLEYLKRVLQRLSDTYLAKGDSRVTEGFVCKNGTKDVHPFHFDASVSHFEQVNHLWKMISDE